MNDNSPASPGEPSLTPSHSAPDSARASEFRWQAFFQRAQEPLFLLNRQRRLLFVNRAWEELTGVPAEEARGVACTRRQSAEPGRWSALARALSPPRQVLQGQGAAVRRAISKPQGRQWWDIDFFPLQDADGLLLVIGKIKLVAVEDAAQGITLPEKLIARRGLLAERFRLDRSDDTSPVLRRVWEQVRLACQTRVPVLIVGEAGSGKRHLARVIHHQGRQREKSIAALTCGGLPEPALVAALFGDTGSLRAPGIGTIYLAEPGRLPRDLQVRLAEFLEEQGENAPRIIAGCRNLEDETEGARLLEELRCALGTLVIPLPPLRERSAELPELAAHVLESMHAGGETLLPKLTSSAMEILQAYSWPSNWRELRQVVSSAMSTCKNERIDNGDLPSYLRLTVKMDQATQAEPERALPLDSLLEQAERRLIQHALKLANGNKSRAAEILSVWRPRLLRRMEALGIKDVED
jgi:PAS domain S-box-containing protein